MQLKCNWVLYFFIFLIYLMIFLTSHIFNWLNFLYLYYDRTAYSKTLNFNTSLPSGKVMLISAAYCCMARFDWSPRWKGPHKLEISYLQTTIIKNKNEKYASLYWPFTLIIGDHWMVKGKYPWRISVSGIS